MPSDKKLTAGERSRRTTIHLWICTHPWRWGHFGHYRDTVYICRTELSVFYPVVEDLGQGYAHEDSNRNRRRESCVFELIGKAYTESNVWTG